jgi:Holliday junction resolvase RusA-like endonuclease
MNETPSTLTFDVPWDALCSDNRKYVSHSGYILSSEYRGAKTRLANHAWVAAKQVKWERATGPVLLMVAVREPDRRRRDLNWSKQVKDAINGSEAVWWDDSQVRQEFWYMAGLDKENPGATITVVLLPTATP